MKTYLSVFSVLCFALLFAACATTEKSSTSDTRESSSAILVKDLPNYIHSLPRLSVNGYGVTNVAASSYAKSKSPLFVLDGVRVGRSLYAVESVLNQNEPVSVEFLKISKATVRYGEEGRNGVIIVNRVRGG